MGEDFRLGVPRGDSGGADMAFRIRQMQARAALLEGGEACARTERIRRRAERSVTLVLDGKGVIE